MVTVTSAQIEKYLKGMEFPGHKDDLVQKAKYNRAPQQVIDTINKLPEKNYTKPTEITKEIGKKKK